MIWTYFDFFFRMGYKQNNTIFSEPGIFIAFQEFLVLTNIPFDFSAYIFYLNKQPEQYFKEDQFLRYVLISIAFIYNNAIRYFDALPAYYKQKESDFQYELQYLIDKIAFGEIGMLPIIEQIATQSQDPFEIEINYGIRFLINFKPLVALLFLSTREHDVKNIVNSVDFSNLDIYTKILDYILDEKRPTPPNEVIMILTEKLLDLDSSFKGLMRSYLKFKKYYNSGLIEWKLKQAKALLKPQEVKAILVENFEDIIQNQVFADVFEDLILDAIIEKLVSKQIDYSTVRNYPLILRPKLVLRLAQTKNHQIVDLIMKALLFESVTLYADRHTSNSISDIVQSIIVARLEKVTSLYAYKQEVITLLTFINDNRLYQYKNKNEKDLERIVDCLRICLISKLRDKELSFIRDVPNQFKIADQCKDKIQARAYEILSEAIFQLIQQNIRAFDQSLIQKVFAALIVKDEDGGSKQMRLISILFRQSLDYVISTIKLKEDLKIETIINSTVFITVIRLENIQTYKAPFIEQIKREASRFFDDLAIHNITLAQIEYIIQKQDELRTIASTFNIAGYKEGLFKDLEDIHKAYKHNLDKYQMFLRFMKQHSTKLDLTAYQSEIEQRVKTYNQEKISSFNPVSVWANFQTFRSADYYYKLGGSNFFQNFFKRKSRKLEDYIIAYNQGSEEVKDGLGIPDNKTDPKGFDRISLEQIFNKKLKRWFQACVQYPAQLPNSTGMTRGKIGQFFAGVNTEKQILEELTKLHDFNRELDNNARPFSDQFQLDLFRYIQLDNLHRMAEVMINLTWYNQGIFPNVTHNEEYKTFNEFLTFSKNLKPTALLSEISREVGKFKRFADDYWVKGGIKIEDLSMIGRSKDTYQFALDHQEANLNDLYERMNGENDLVQSSVIEDLTYVSNLFWSMQQHMKSKKTKDIDFRRFIVQLYCEFKELELKDQRFNSRLERCITGVGHVINMMNQEFNTAEDTLKVIGSLFQTGRLQWKYQFEKQKYEFQVEIRTQQQDKSHSVQKIDQDKLNTHCQRGILLMATKKIDPAKEQEQKQQINDFREIIGNGEVITHYLNELQDIGHQKYRKNMGDREINYEKDRDLKEGCKYFCEEVADDHQSWKQLLTEIKTNRYLLTYIPNKKLHDLEEFFRNPTQQSLHPIMPVFKYINKNITESAILQHALASNMPQSGNQEQSLEALGYNLEVLYGRQDTRRRIQGVSERDTKLSELWKQVPKGKTVFVTAQHDYEICETIISMFQKSGYYPEASQILFCEGNTTLHEVENFILRATLAPKYYKDNKGDRLFLIVNFQNLPLYVQTGVYQNIMRISPEFKEYMLCILIQCQAVRDANVIEDVRQGNPKAVANIKQDEGFLNLLRTLPNQVRCIYSQYSGVGKSTFIKEQIEGNGLNYVRIPLQGELNRTKVARLHMESRFGQEWTSDIGIHYDISPQTSGSINYTLFELVVLGCVYDGGEGIFHLPEQCQIYCEIATALVEDLERKNLFIGHFKCYPKQWELDTLKVMQNPDDKYQLVGRFLDAMKRQQYDFDRLYHGEPILSKNDCLNLLDYFIISKLQRPNFYILNNFVSLMSAQLRNLIASVYLNPEFLPEQLQLQRGAEQEAKAIIIQIVNSLYEFSFTLSNNEQAVGVQNQNLIREDSEEEEARKFENMKWENNKSLFVLINESGSLRPIYKELRDVPKGIIRLFDLQKKAMKKKDGELVEYSSISNQDTLIEFILEVCVEDRLKEKVLKEKDLKKIVFTRDNFLKLVLIYIRIKVALPVILMGETGVGKTAIINYLSDILYAEFKILDVHAGLTEKEIVSWVLEAQVQAYAILNDKQSQGRLVILFFDEINTNENVKGLLKEILIDRHIQGIPLVENIRLVAACNPYKLKPKGMTAISCGIRHKLASSEMSKLVYSVQPLPDSMLSFIWDYGSLPASEEQVYITKLIEQCNLLFEEADQYNDVELKQVVRLVCFAQGHIRERESQWAVSLRDAARFVVLLKFFMQNNVSKMRSDIRTDYNHKQRAAVTSLVFCYYYRINKIEDRKDFIQKAGSIPIGKHQRFLNSTAIELIIAEEQQRYLDQMEIPPGIGRNTSLQENVFVIISCILNNIPLIITGKPGSSKTLAMNLIIKSMKGKSSSADIFKHLPSLIQYSYQGSVQSDSKGIQKVFDKAITQQQKINSAENKNNSRTMVFIDEIGLAEISPFNPLKVLHALLEPSKKENKVPFVGISNWSLDASKMNRAITLSRPDPSKDDLRQSIESIALDICQKNDTMNFFLEFKAAFVDSLVEMYEDYMKEQADEIDLPDTRHHKNFHGLRDFYQLAQQITRNLSDSISTNKRTVLMGLYRNFGGKMMNRKHSYPVLKHALNRNLIQEQTIQSMKDETKIDSLVRANINDTNSRHLMLISDNEGFCIQYIQSICNSHQQEYQVFLGSDFPDDKTSEFAHKMIYDIILCMERGIVSILLNLDDVYQSFYDMLNLNYQIIKEQKYCKVAIGSDSTKSIVHEKFKCVLITNMKQVKNMDAPLLNRFEKQIMLEEDIVSDLEKNKLLQLKEFIAKAMKAQNRKEIGVAMGEEFKIEDAFPGLNEKELIYLVSNNNGYALSLEKCYNLITQLSSVAGMIRLKGVENLLGQNDFLEMARVYNEKSIHYSLESLITHVTYLCKTSQEKSTNKEDEEEKMSVAQEVQPSEDFISIQDPKTFKGFNFIVHTFSPFGGAKFDMAQKVKQIYIYEIMKQKKLEEEVFDFLCQDRLQNLVIYSDAKFDTQERLHLIRNVINNQRLRANQMGDDYTDNYKHIYLVIRQERNQMISLPLSQDWLQIYADTINNGGKTKHLTLDRLCTQSIEALFSDNNIIADLVDLSISAAVSSINLNSDSDWAQDRVQRIKTFMSSQDTIETVKKLTLLTIHTKRLVTDPRNPNWISEVAGDLNLMTTYYSLHESALQYLITLFTKPLRFIIYHMQINGVIRNRPDPEVSNEIDIYDYFALPYFEKLYEESFIQDPIQETYDIPNEIFHISYPFARRIHRLFEDNKALLTKFLIDANTQLQLKLNSVQKFENEEENERQKAFIEDQLLIIALNNIHSQYQVFFSQDLQDYKIESENIDAYFVDFPYLIDPLNTKQHFSLYLTKTLKLIIKNREFNTLPEMYPIYWKYEDLMTMSYDILAHIPASIKPIHHIINDLQLLVESSFEFKNQKIHYLPRSVYCKCLSQCLFSIFFPSEQTLNKFTKNKITWYQSAKIVFDKLKDLLIEFTNKLETQETKIIGFLITYCEEVLCLIQQENSELLCQIASAMRPGVTFREHFQNLMARQDVLSQIAFSENDGEFYIKKFQQKLIAESISDSSNQQDRQDAAAIGLDMILTEFKAYNNPQFAKLQPYLIRTLKKICDYVNIQAPGIFTDFTQQFITLLPNSSILTLIQDAIQNQGLTYENPFVVALCDAIQSVIQKYDHAGEVFEVEEENKEAQTEQDERMRENLQTAVSLILREDIMQIDKIRCLAYFKHHAYQLSTQIIDQIKGSDDEQRQVNQYLIDSFEQCFTSVRREACVDLMLYIVKQLYLKLEPDQIKVHCSRRLRWLTFLKLPENTHNEFPIPFDEARKAELQNLRISQQIQVPAENNANPQDYLELLELFYLNNKHESFRQSIRTRIDQSGMSELKKKFIGNYMSFKDFDNELIKRVLTIDYNENNRNIRRLQTLMAYVGTLAFSAPNYSFLYKMATQPDLDTLYLPFMITCKEEPMYFNNFFRYDFEKSSQILDEKVVQLCRYKCKRCGLIFVVIDCGALSSHRGVAQKVGEQNCQQCGIRVGANAGKVNTDRIDLESRPRADFYNQIENVEAIRGYIPIDHTVLDGMQIRISFRPNLTLEKSWTEAQFRIGLLLLDLLLLISILFGDRQACQTITNKFRVQADANNVQVECYKFMIRRVDHGFERLKTLYNITDEKLLMVMMETTKNLFKNSNQPWSVLATLNSTQGRRGFEQGFFDICVPSAAGSFQQFMKEVPLQSQELALIYEQVDPLKFRKNEAHKSYMTILRNQIPISRLQIEHYLSQLKASRNKTEDPSAESYLILEQTLHQYTSIARVKSLDKIISWVRYSQMRWSGKISTSESLELSTLQIIERDYERTQNKDIYDKDIEMFENLIDATQVMTNLSWQDGCDSVIMHPIKMTSKFQQCAVTTAKKNSLGYPTGLMIHYLSYTQNFYLEAISKAPQLNWLNDLKRNKKNVLSLKEHEIVAIDDEIDWLINFVQERSFSQLKYGEGQINHYMLEDINAQLIHDLIYKKAFIDYSSEINFQFSDEGSLYNQYNVIEETLHQEPYENSQGIVNSLRTERDKIELLNGLRTGINYLHYSALQFANKLPSECRAFRDKSLSQFLIAYLLQDTAQKIDGQAKIKHFFHIYESIERSHMDSLVQKTHAKYKAPISDFIIGRFKEILMSMEEEHVEKALSILGRLCIRNFTLEESISDAGNMFREIFLVDIYEHIHGIVADEKRDEHEKMLAVISTRFEEIDPTKDQRNAVTFGQAYYAYQVMRQVLDEKIRLRQQKEQEEKQNQKVASQSQKDDDLFYGLKRTSVSVSGQNKKGWKKQEQPKSLF